MDKVRAVTATVISQAGVCDLGHKPGDAVTFTETGVEGRICIHALYTLMPKVFAMMFNARFPWAKDPDVLTHACPDAANPVVFELRREYEESPGAEPAGQPGLPVPGPIGNPRRRS